MISMATMRMGTDRAERSRLMVKFWSWLVSARVRVVRVPPPKTR